MGAPGKVVKELNEQQVAMLKTSADHYVTNAKRFSEDLVRLD
jgi:carbonic anhydrase/acetyltransferase-like protein (isoleucine patch superfamily)